MAIRPDPEPKSASPRSGAPKGELEQYGVWVKAEPQDVAEEISIPDSGDSDFDLPLEAASVPEESFLSADEEKLLGSFDTEFEPSSESESVGPLPDIEDMPPLEESLLPSDPSSQAGDSGDLSETIDISLDEFDIPSQAPSFRPDDKIDMSSVEGLEPAPPASPAGEIEDVSSEFLDLAEEPALAPSSGSTARPAPSSDFGSGIDDVTAEFLDVEDTVASPASKDSSADFEPLDIDLHFDDLGPEPAAVAAPPSSSAASEPGFEAVTEFDDFLSADGSKASSAVPDFDDVSAVERELSDPVPQISPSPTASASRPRDSSSPDLSTEILLKIANELSSIRGELVSLKSQIGDVVASAEAIPHKPAEAQEAEPPQSEGPSGGFFDDEEDETIALTGDELDNILNTADFTEELAETEQPLDLEMDSSAEDTPPDGLGLLDESLLPETGDYSAAIEPAIEEVRLGQEDSVDEVAPPSIGGDVLDLVADEGVLPQTPAPDDTSYLESPDLPLGEAGIEDLDLGTPPPSDEPLVEPDLSELNLETEDLEPRLDIDEELPLAGTEPQVEEITLDIEAGPEYISPEEKPSDAEFLEAIPEIDEPNFAEINLHEEKSDSELIAEPSQVSELMDAEEITELSDSDFSSLDTNGLSTQSLDMSLDEVSPLEESAPLMDEEDLILGTEDEALEPLPEAEALPESESLFEPEPEPEPEPISARPKATPAKAPVAVEAESPKQGEDGDRLKSEIRSVLSYLDKLLDSLPEEKIEEFARSEYFDTYKKLFEELGLV